MAAYKFADSLIIASVQALRTPFVSCRYHNCLLHLLKFLWMFHFTFYIQANQMEIRTSLQK